MEQITKPPHDIFEQLITAWKAWPREDHALLPSRQSISPKDLGKILPYVILLEDKGRGIIEYCLVGEQIKILYGANLKGITTEHDQPTNVNQVELQRSLIMGMVEHQNGMIATRKINHSWGNGWLYSTCCLPLSDGDGNLKYYLIAGKLMQPESYKASDWSLANTFRLAHTTIISVERLDLGNGAYDLISKNPGDVEDLGVRII